MARHERNWFLAAVLSLAPLSAGAWGDLGHQTVGYLAESHLNSDGRAFVESILGPEPLALAAIWPDQVREDELRYKIFASYHLCDVPGERYSLEEAKSKTPRDCYAVLKQGPELLRDPHLERDVKMIVLRYLVHVVGDLHQPLHIGNGLDLGANLCEVRMKSGTREVRGNLHSFWDTKVIETLKPQNAKGYFGAQQLASVLHARYRSLRPLEKQSLVKGSSLDWIEESAELRRREAYPDQAVGFQDRDERKRPYCKYLEFDGRIRLTRDTYFDKNRIPLIEGETLSRIQELARFQIWKAGYRLGHLLNELGREWASREKTKATPGQAIQKTLELLKHAPDESTTTKPPSVLSEGTDQAE